MKKTSPKRKSQRPSIPAVAAEPPADAVLKEGVEAAKDFFDRVDDPVLGRGLRTAIAANQQNIIDLALGMGLKFDYDEMQEHLIARWDVRKPPHMYCCT